VSLGYQASPSVVLSSLLLTDKPWFLTEGTDLPLCSSYFPLGVSQLSGHNHHQLHASHQALFWRHCRGRSGRPLQGKFFTRTSFTLFYCFALLYLFLLALFYIKNPKKNSLLYIVAFIFLLLIFAIMSNHEVEVRSFKQQGGESLKDAWYRINNAHHRCTKKHSTTILLRNFYIGISSWNRYVLDTL
jgi:hypothetical protein